MNGRIVVTGTVRMYLLKIFGHARTQPPGRIETRGGSSTVGIRLGSLL